MSEDNTCGSVDRQDAHIPLRIASIFVILATSVCGTLFPIVAKRSPYVNLPTPVFEFAKYFGSGVIIATAFIHLLSPAFEELGSPCLNATWLSYPFAAAFSMISVFFIFFAELFTFRAGAQLIAKSGLKYNLHAGPTAHTHEDGGAHHHHGIDDTNTAAESVLEPSTAVEKTGKKLTVEDEESLSESDADDLHPASVSDADALAQLVGVAVLEFGVVLHSIIIGLTLAVDEDFTTLFIVIIFHQMFEGLGLGSRLAYLVLPSKFKYAPYVAGLTYAIMTPLGIAIGLGVRRTYNPDSTTANIVSGTLDAFSSGILLYTGLVELLAHEFLFNPKMHQAPLSKVLYAGACMLTGAGIMALLGRWA